MRSAERQRKLQQLFATQEFASIEDLRRLLAVSEATARRDLNLLEESGQIRRVHGGAISLVTRDESLDYGQLSTSCRAEKMRIGRVAASLIEEGQTVILGGGSTAVEVARNLFGRTLQVITNSIPIAQVFWDCKRVEVTLTGGYLYPRLGLQLGPVCEQTLSSISADVFIMGIGGMTKKGLSDSNALIVGSIRKMIEVSRRVIVVADHTKFGRDRMVHVATFADIDAVVTDSAIAPEQQRFLKAQGVECVLA